MTNFEYAKTLCKEFNNKYSEKIGCYLSLHGTAYWLQVGLSRNGTTGITASDTVSNRNIIQLTRKIIDRLKWEMESGLDYDKARIIVGSTRL